MLDGEGQANHIVYVATTNYPEALDSRFVDRPSRFDTVTYIGMPSTEARKMYFQSKEPELETDELEHWVRSTKGFSIAHLKELIIGVKCLKQPVDEVIERLAAMHERRPTSDDNDDKASFTGFIRNKTTTGKTGFID